MIQILIGITIDIEVIVVGTPPTAILDENNAAVMDEAGSIILEA